MLSLPKLTERWGKCRNFALLRFVLLSNRHLWQRWELRIHSRIKRIGSKKLNKRKKRVRKIRGLSTMKLISVFQWILVDFFIVSSRKIFPNYFPKFWIKTYKFEQFSWFFIQNFSTRSSSWFPDPFLWWFSR